MPTQKLQAGDEAEAATADPAAEAATADPAAEAAASDPAVGKAHKEKTIMDDFVPHLDKIRFPRAELQSEYQAFFEAVAQLVAPTIHRYIFVLKKFIDNKSTTDNYDIINKFSLATRVKLLPTDTKLPLINQNLSELSRIPSAGLQGIVQIPRPRLLYFPLLP